MLKVQARTMSLIDVLWNRGEDSVSTQSEVRTRAVLEAESEAHALRSMTREEIAGYRRRPVAARRRAAAQGRSHRSGVDGGGKEGREEELGPREVGEAQLAIAEGVTDLVEVEWRLRRSVGAFTHADDFQLA